MALWFSKSHSGDADALLQALDRTQAVVEFDPSGEIKHANQTFLDTMGYSLAEIVGHHHGMFVEEDERNSESYRAFWDELRGGKHRAGEFKRLAKGSRRVWLQSSYTPILDRAGKVARVVKFANDITAQKSSSLQDAGRISAIMRSQAVIEFDLDGRILTANENFLKTMGYTLAEIQGKHHSIFIEPAKRETAEYREFWARLRRGEFDSSEYKRIGKGGKEVWILATYNPIVDDRGRPTGVIKFATDITSDKLAMPTIRDRSRRSASRRRWSSSPWTGRSCPPTRTSSRPSATPWPKSGASITACSSIQASATRRLTSISGPAFSAANISATSSSEFPNPATTCGSWRPTIRSWI